MLDGMMPTGLQDVKGADDVRADIRPWLFDRMANPGLRPYMEHHARAQLGEQPYNSRLIQQHEPPEAEAAMLAQQGKPPLLEHNGVVIRHAVDADEDTMVRSGKPKVFGRHEVSQFGGRLPQDASTSAAGGVRIRGWQGSLPNDSSSIRCRQCRRLRDQGQNQLSATHKPSEQAGLHRSGHLTLPHANSAETGHSASWQTGCLSPAGPLSR
jgi:hypothetical protein